MKRVIATALITMFLAAPALAGDRHRNWDRDRGSSTSSRILDAMVTMSLLGLITQGAQQQSYDPYARSFKDPYRQPNIPGDPYPPRALK